MQRSYILYIQTTIETIICIDNSINVNIIVFQCYRRILQLDPTNIQGLHNLCVVMVERGKLGLAAQCLEHAAALAPHQDYVQRHLSIVRTRISRLPPDQRDTDVFDDSFWSSNVKDIPFNTVEPSNGQFIGKTESVFSNHATVHNHIGSKQSNTDSLNNHIIHLKGPSKPARAMSGASTTETKEQSPKQATVPELSNIVEPTTDRVFDRVISADITKLDITQKHGSKHATSDQFNQSAAATISGKQGMKQTKDSALS